MSDHFEDMNLNSTFFKHKNEKTNPELNAVVPPPPPLPPPPFPRGFFQKKEVITEDERWNYPPYSFSWVENSGKSEGEGSIFPYVISVAGHLDFHLSDERKEQTERRIHDTLYHYLEQVVKKWERLAGPRFPLILMTHIFDDCGKLMTEIAFELQEKYESVHVLSILPLEYEKYLLRLSDEKKRDFERLYAEFYPEEKSPQNLQKQKERKRHLWELKTQDLSKRVQEQYDARKGEFGTDRCVWRSYNETAAIYSHLMIVLWDGKDDVLNRDDHLGWLVRFKLEGLCDQTFQADADVLTYTAIGPVLHLLMNKNTLEEDSEELLPAYYYPDGAEITEEKEEHGKDEGTENFCEDEKRVLRSYEDFPNLSKRGFISHFLRKNNVAFRKDVYNNIFALGNINRDIWKTGERSPEKTIEEYISDFIHSQNQKAGVKMIHSHRRNENDENIEVEFIPNADTPTKQLINHFRVVERVAGYFKVKTEKLIQHFCWAFFSFLFFSSLFSFWTEMFLRLYRCGSFGFFSAIFLHHTLPTGISSSRLVYFHLIILFFITAMLLASMCWVGYCCVLSFHGWHYKYHRFRTLAECLRVQTFWRIGGLDHLVSGNFRSHQIETLDWLRVTLTGLYVTIPASYTAREPTLHIRLIDKIWVEAMKSDLSKEQKNTKRLLQSPLFNPLYQYKPQWRTLCNVIFIFIFCVGIFFQYLQLELLLRDSMAPGPHTGVTHFMVYRLIYSIIFSAMIILWVYRRMKLTDKENRMKEQLRVPFEIADYLLDTIWEHHREDERNLTEKGLSLCKTVLHQLGQEVLAKHADWLLEATKRDLKSPK